MNDNQLIESHKALIHKLAHKYKHSGVPFEDLVQEGMIGILEAKAHFDSAKNVKFSTYAVYWIKKRMLNAIANEKKHSLDAMQLDSNTVSEKTDTTTKNADIDSSLLKDMPEIEKKVILMLYQEQLTLNEIAQKLNITRERARQTKEKALRRLKIMDILIS
jgi:RNA polymerase sigma factor (sigma-70 family)